MNWRVFGIPFPIVLVACFFFAFPFLVFFSAASLYDLEGQWGLVFSKIRPIQYLIFLLCFAISYGLFFKKKFGYYLFLLLSAIMICYNLWITISMLLGKTIVMGGIAVQWDQILPITSVTVLLLGFIFLFLHREIRAPYLSSVDRGWRGGYRESLPVPYSLTCKDKDTKASGISVNISLGGALLALPDNHTFVPQVPVRLQLNLEDEQKNPKPLVLSGVLVRVFQEKKNSLAAVQFHFSPEEEATKASLQSFLQRVFSPRFSVLLPAFALWNSQEIRGILWDISHEGLYMEAQSSPLLGEKVSILWRVFLLGELEVEGVVRWSNDNAQYGKPKGFGVLIEKVRQPIRFQVWVLWKKFLAPMSR